MVMLKRFASGRKGLALNGMRNTVIRRAMTATTLVLGGAASGKSRYAESLFNGPAVYIATAEAGDAEMAARIARHRARRGPCWTTVEAPLSLPEALVEAGDSPVLADCLTLWLANALAAGREPETGALLAALAGRQRQTVLVSNETGMGLVPATPLGRRFREAQGRLNQQVARLADRVVFIAAGLPLLLKS